MTILESPWFLVLLVVLSAVSLFMLRVKRPRPEAAALLVCLAPMLLLVAGLWNRHAGLREELQLNVERFLPSAVELDQLPALPTEAKDADVMMVMLGVGGPQPLLGFLHAHGPTGFRREEPQGRFAVVFREALEPALLEALKPHPPLSQRLVAKWGKEARDISAEPGQTLEAAGGTFRVVALYPDFEVRPDAQGRPVMGSRSKEPRDPWLEVDYSRPGNPARRVLLSAWQPELTRRLNAPNLPEGLSLDYLREGEETQSRFVVFSRRDHRVSLVEHGTVIRFETTATNRPFVVAPGLSVTALGFFDRFYPASSLARALPAMRLNVADLRSGRTERAWLRPGDTTPQGFFNGKVRVGFLPLGRDSKDIRVEVRGVDGRGVEWAPRVVKLAEGGASATLYLQRRPAAWLGWAALGMLLAGSGSWLVFRRR